MLCFDRPVSGTFAEYSVKAQLVIFGDFGVCGVEPLVMGVSVMLLYREEGPFPITDRLFWLRGGCCLSAEGRRMHLELTFAINWYADY
jgi:hypothetical protein